MIYCHCRMEVRVSMREYQEMYDHVRVSGERKSEILREITGENETDQSKLQGRKHPRLMIAAAIVAAALVVILPVGGYASQKMNTHFTYSVEREAKDHAAILHFYKQHGETLGYEYMMERTPEATLAKYIRNAHPNYYVKLSYSKEALGVGKDYTIYKRPTKYTDDYANVRFQYRRSEYNKLMKKCRKETNPKKQEKIVKAMRKYDEKEFVVTVYYINRAKNVRMLYIKDVERMKIGENRAYYFKGICPAEAQTKAERMYVDGNRENTIWIFDENVGYCMVITGGDGLSEKEMKEIAKSISLKKTTKEKSMEFSVISTWINEDGYE